MTPDTRTMIAALVAVVVLTVASWGVIYLIAAGAEHSVERGWLEAP
jgi:hypothetical protein